MNLFRELQRRNVVRVAVTYAVVAWLLIQVGATLEPAMHLPDWVDSVLAFFLLLGFPVAMFFAWAYELTPEGLKRDSEAQTDEAVRALAGRKWDRGLLFVLVIAVAYFAADKYWFGRQALHETFTAEQSPTAVPGGERESTSRESVVAPAKSIAVLPFLNMSPDPEQEYFSDGLTEELLNLLAGIDGLKVAARTSSFYYKDKLDEIVFSDVARQLGVAHILEGSVRRSGNKIRITAQLVKAEDGFHLWSDTYDRELDDVFAIQDEISAKVVESLKLTLLGDAPHAAVLNTESYELGMQGRYLYNRRNEGDLERALELFEKAVELDPNNLTAWVGAVPLYLYLSNPPRVEDARVAALKALELDPQHPEATARLAMVRAYEGNAEEAKRLFERALKLGPDNTLVLSMNAGMLLSNGQMDQAIELQRHAVRMDPLHATNVGNLSGYLVQAGRLEEAERWNARAGELAQENVAIEITRVHILVLQQRAEEALSLISELESRFSEDEYASLRSGPNLTFFKICALFSAGNQAASDALLADFRKARVETRLDVEAQKPLEIAYLHAWRGEADEAFELLQQVIDQYPNIQRDFLLDPFLYNLHGDPRWAGIQAVIDTPRL